MTGGLWRITGEQVARAAAAARGMGHTGSRHTTYIMHPCSALPERGTRHACLCGSAAALARLGAARRQAKQHSALHVGHPWSVCRIRVTASCDVMLQCIQRAGRSLVLPMAREQEQQEGEGRMQQEEGVMRR
jgi:hypothetical protein